MKNFLSALAFLTPLVLVGCGDSSLKSRDVVGVQLGMTLSEVQAALIKHNSSIKFQTRTPDSNLHDGAPQNAESTVELLASGKLEGGAKENFRINFLESSQKAVSISRTVAVSDGPDISSETYDEALKKKYGTPIVTGGTKMHPHVFAIGFDSQGKADAKCVNVYGEPSSAKQGCGDSLSVFYEGRQPGNPNLFNRYTINLVDAAAQLQETERVKAASRNAREAEAKKAQDAAKSTKPDL